MYQEHQGAHTCEVGGPWEHDQGDGDGVMEEHL